MWKKPNFLPSGGKLYRRENMNLIKSIYIKNFRSIREVSINCTGMNIFSGLNDVGKSTVLKALNLFFNGETDFNTSFNFEIDYNKNARVSKRTKEIVIRLEFNLPDSYKSTKKSFPTVFLEKIYDANGSVKVSSTADGIEKKSRANQKNLLSRFYTSMEYIYVPAFKDTQVQQSLLRKLADLDIVDTGKISQVNKDIQTRLADMQKSLKDLGIGFQTKFELPMYGKAFWNQLDINTTYDNLDEITKTLERRQHKKHSVVGKGYDIPLTYRGEGIKSKYIPAFLSWYQQFSTKQLIWGIDEPENSLEIEASRKLAKLFFSKYINENQIFITTHSSAFLYPPDETNINIFRCWKDKKADTIIQLIRELSNENRIRLFKELGILAIEKEHQSLYEDKIKKLDQEKETFKQIIEQKKKIILLPEDKRTDIYKVAWLFLQDITFTQTNLKTLFDKHAFFTIPDLQNAGADPLSNLFANPIMKSMPHSQKLVALFDCDRTGIEKFNRIKRSNQILYDAESSTHYIKIADSMYACLLPIPDRFQQFIDIFDPNSAAFLEVELLLPSQLLLDKGWATKKPNGQLRVAQKKAIHRQVYSLEKDDFKDFQNIFNFLDRINKGLI